MKAHSRAPVATNRPWSTASTQDLDEATAPSLATGTPTYAAQTIPLAEAVGSLPLATESRHGYTREAFKHWNSGDDPADGYTTRTRIKPVGQGPFATDSRMATYCT
ncbi:hypothetical protein ACFZDI_11000 [Streptomyces sp. NPDC007907]|uniref:hypothetical protein n=1 Tax=Streptomyces sp. NPDC007907 TaxID=3364789 RepID=UPI0036E4081D